MKLLRPASISFLLLAICAGLAAFGSSKAAPSADVFHTNTPAGYEVIELEPSGSTLSLLGLVECREVEGAQHKADGSHGKVVNADGETLSHFPRHFSFRITASLRRTLLENASYKLVTNEDPQNLLLKLGFRLKMYDGLKMRELTPESVQMIGVPADVPYDERVYRVSFDVGDLPVTNRVVLEVLSPEGERLTRFHFELL